MQMVISWPAWVEATSMIPFSMTLYNRVQSAESRIPIVTQKVLFHSRLFLFSVSLDTKLLIRSSSFTHFPVSQQTKDATSCLGRFYLQGAFSR